jgi:hypothetical protein
MNIIQGKNFDYSAYISITMFDIFKWQGVEPVHQRKNEMTVLLMETDRLIGK